MDLKKNYLELVEKVKKWSESYYSSGTSAVSDQVFDAAIKELIIIEEQNPELKLKDSPTAVVGGAGEAIFTKIKHQQAMLSLDNIYDTEELGKWLKDIESFNIKDYKIIAELKIDGLAIALRYKNGKFHQAITRGDGEFGEDITHNIKTVKNIPLTIDSKENVEVRGELYFPIENFNSFNEQLVKDGQAKLQNPRNAAAGTARLKKTADFIKRGLAIVAYDYTLGFKGNSHYDAMLELKKNRFLINPEMQECKDLAAIKSFIDRIEKKRDSFEFGIDGIVLKLDNLEQRELLGFTAKSPRWAKAWKFKEQAAESQLKDIELSVSRSGKITPIAILEPVLLAGTIVKRASLFNYKNIEKLDLRLNDYVMVEKGGEIIPAIVEVVKSKRAKNSVPVKLVTKCPVCESQLVASESLIDLFCENKNCPAKHIGYLEHFISGSAFNIEFLAEKQLEFFINKGWLKSAADLFLLEAKRDELLLEEGFGDKKINNLFSAINKAKNITLPMFIYSLGINGIGEKAAQTIAGKILIWDEFFKLTKDDLMNLSDFGPKQTQSVLDWIENKENVNFVEQLFANGVKVASYQPPTIKGIVVITGTLSTPRKIWEARLLQAGFTLGKSITKQTNYLLVGEKAGSKLAEATKLGITIINETQASEILK